MNSQSDRFSNLRSLSENYSDMRGGLIIPSGLITGTIGAKLLFSPYDKTLVENPSLFDTTNTFWAITELTLILFSVLLIVGISVWYRNRLGHKVPTWNQRANDIFFGILALVVTFLSIFIDYQLILPFSSMGLVFCGMWIAFIKKNPSIQKSHILFFLVQLAALVVGPVIVAESQPDSLVHMREMVGLNMFTAGIMLCISGYFIHKSLIQQLPMGHINATEQ